MAGDLEQAIADFSRAIELEPENATAYRGRGVAYNESGDPDQALADFERAIELQPDEATTYYSRGLT